MPTKQAISAVERQRRENAVNFARASVGLEGFKVSDEYEVQAKRFIEGDIELSELTKAAHEQVVKR